VFATAKQCCKTQAVRALFQRNINFQPGIFSVSVNQKTLWVFDYSKQSFFEAAVEGIGWARKSIQIYIISVQNCKLGSTNLARARSSRRKTYKWHIRECLPSHAGMA
jgi:hypothetical protein